GQAPLALRWLDELDVAAQAPEYLHKPERHELPYAPAALPYGTQVTVRGAPLHAGRRLFLHDGGDAASEVPFVDDGAGGVVARWRLTRSASLRVVAAFGDVVIREADSLDLVSIPDQAPRVTVEGAPRQVSLLTETQDIEVRYQASDDHGLREVDLVLRSGTREERRLLSRFDGETESDAGGYVLKLRDPFLRKSHAPVELTVEAKDNDPLTGPKWGASLPITLVPPVVGEPEANRLEALVGVRDALVDSLDWRLSAPPAGPQRAEHLAEERRRVSADADTLSSALARRYGGIGVPARLRAALLAQQEKVRASVEREGRAPSAETHAGAVKASERYVLVVDAVVRGLGQRDAREAARLLADVADDLALGASQARDPDAEMQDPATAGARSRATARMDAATTVLSGGGSVLLRLGPLGRDLGEIIGADLLRVDRARRASDFAHAELAARDLATRLREPDPSFGARGGAGRAGGESGGGRGTPGDDEGAPDDVEQAFEEAAREIEQLAQDHAGEMGKVQQALDGATSDDEKRALADEEKRHAEAVREAARPLPRVGQGSDSWTSKGAAARELAEQMARSLEQGQGAEALQSGRSAVSALDEAKKMLDKGGWFEDPSGEERRRVEEARRKIESERGWIEKALEQAQRRAAERARKDLERGGEDEGKLADRGQKLAEEGRDRGSLPMEAVELLDDAERAARQAADALKRGDAERGLERQKEAQRSLEAAEQQLRGDDDARGDDSGKPAGEREGDEARGSGRVDVPKAGQHKGPEEFRRRVVRGLGRPAGGALKEAVRRYAEGLLR
ncbi:MAG: DUF4175 domain-containing protein, partial [Myxococcales bacterium]|nr:DUF4175 domain-containing protein [Myxococcales bacterium]